MKSSAERLPNLLVGVFVFILFLLVGKLLQRVITNITRRTHSIDDMLANLVSRIISTHVTIFGFLAACVVIFPSFKPGDIIAGLGITSVAIGFAFKDILQNFFAGILLLWRRPFKVGDQIKVKEFEGTIEEINLRSTRLKTYDGERIILPNAEVYMSSVLVRTAYENRRVKFVISLSPSDSLEEIRQTILQTLANTDGVLKNPAPSVFVSDLASTSLNLTIYFWTQSQQANVLMISNKVATQIKLALDEASFNIA